MYTLRHQAMKLQIRFLDGALIRSEVLQICLATCKRSFLLVFWFLLVVLWHKTVAVRRIFPVSPARA